MASDCGVGLAVSTFFGVLLFGSFALVSLFVVGFCLFLVWQTIRQECCCGRRPCRTGYPSLLEAQCSIVMILGVCLGSAAGFGMMTYYCSYCVYQIMGKIVACDQYGGICATLVFCLTIWTCLGWRCFGERCGKACRHAVEAIRDKRSERRAARQHAENEADPEKGVESKGTSTTAESEHSTSAGSCTFTLSTAEGKDSVDKDSNDTASMTTTDVGSDGAECISENDE